MPIKIFILIKTLIIVLLLVSNIYAAELTILPLKKPILDKVTADKKIAKSIITPKSKPKKNNIFTSQK